MADEEAPRLTAEGYRFATWYIHYRDIRKAAERAHITRKKGQELYDSIEVQEEIERQEAVILSERAKIIASRENLNDDLLERELLKLITLDEREHPGAKQRAIELGLVLRGRITAGSLKTLDIPTPDDDAPAPSIYTAFIPVGVPVEAAPILPPSDKPAAFAVAPPPGRLQAPKIELDPAPAPAKPKSSSKLETW